MGNFRGNGKGGHRKGGNGGRGFNNNRGGYGSDRGERELFSATCAECGNSCKVPFRPSGDKPVLCGDCFSKGKPPRRDDRGGRYDRGSRDDRPRRDDRRDGRRDDRGSRDAMNNRSEHYDMEFEKLHAKLDKILQLLTPKHINRLAAASDESDATEDADNVETE